MGKWATLLIAQDGVIYERKWSKPQAPRTLRAWCSHMQAGFYKNAFCAVRLGRSWHIIDREHGVSVRSFKRDQQAAAEMWLLHRGRK